MQKGGRGGCGLKVGIKSSGDNSVENQQIHQGGHSEEQCVPHTALKADGEQSGLGSHFSARANSASGLYSLPAGATPGREESGDGSRLSSLSPSLFLFSMGVKEMFSCLAGSASCSFAALVAFEADVPSKESKGKVKSAREIESDSSQFSENIPSQENRLGMNINVNTEALYC